jgi:hypothetical protein
VGNDRGESGRVPPYCENTVHITSAIDRRKLQWLVRRRKKVGQEDILRLFQHLQRALEEAGKVVQQEHSRDRLG